MNRPCVLVYLEDATLQDYVKSVAEKNSFDFFFAKIGEQLGQYVDSFSALMLIVDVTAIDTAWIFKHISNVKAKRPNFPIVALIPPHDDALRGRLESAGCLSVLTTKEFQDKLPGVIDNVLRLGH